LPAQLFDQLHTDWKLVLSKHKASIDQIEEKLLGSDCAPEFESVFRTLSDSIENARVVIFGQDPYPSKGHANGLAFSVNSSVSPLPPSLRNIFAELATDCGVERLDGDLTDWFGQGVLLVNRVLSTEAGTSLAHADFGWNEITETVAQELGNRDVVAILWGKNAGELSEFFRPEWRIESVHPSPLSVYRGFFGSKPFSRCNDILLSNNMRAIDW
jgi:uracil-DNA glycosylase